MIWLWVKNKHPKWNPGKWKHGLQPAVFWLNFDPYSFELLRYEYAIVTTDEPDSSDLEQGLKLIQRGLTRERV